MGNSVSLIFSSSSSSSGSSSGTTRNVGGVSMSSLTRDADSPFIKLVRKTCYYLYRKCNETYEIYIGSKGVHRLLLLRRKALSINSPFISVEINTSDMKSIRREMHQYDDFDPKEKIGTLNDFSLVRILATADLIVEKMGRYDLTEENCQHFCNNMLYHFRFKPRLTTPGFFEINKKEITVEVSEKDVEEFTTMILKYLDDSEYVVYGHRAEFEHSNAQKMGLVKEESMAVNEFKAVRKFKRTGKYKDAGTFNMSMEAGLFVL